MNWPQFLIVMLAKSFWRKQKIVLIMQSVHKAFFWGRTGCTKTTGCLDLVENWSKEGWGNGWAIPAPNLPTSSVSLGSCSSGLPCRPLLLKVNVLNSLLSTSGWARAGALLACCDANMANGLRWVGLSSVVGQCGRVHGSYLPPHELPRWHSRNENFIFKEGNFIFFSGKQAVCGSVCGAHIASAQRQAEVPVQVPVAWRKREEVCTLVLLSPLRGLPSGAGKHRNACWCDVQM